VATVLLAGGCASGYHPGAAAVVGKTEISVGDVDKTSRAVSAALGQDFSTTDTLNQLVDNELLAQLRAQRNITVSNAETASVAPRVLNNEAVYQKFQADPVARDFLNQVAAGAITTIKLGGGTSVDDPDLQAKQQQGAQVVRDAAKNIRIDVAPRFGKWTGSTIDGSISGSLSTESKQTEANRKATEAPQQPQG